MTYREDHERYHKHGPAPTAAPRRADRCWPFPCRDYHATAVHLDGSDPCACPCHGPRLDRYDATKAGARLAEAHARQREHGDVWAGVEAARAGKTTHQQRYYESHDDYETREAIRWHESRGPLDPPRWPILAAAR